MNCGNCLMERAKIIQLSREGLCPHCDKLELQRITRERAKRIREIKDTHVAFTAGLQKLESLSVYPGVATIFDTGNEARRRARKSGLKAGATKRIPDKRAKLKGRAERKEKVEGGDQ